MIQHLQTGHQTCLHIYYVAPMDNKARKELPGSPKHEHPISMHDTALTPSLTGNLSFTMELLPFKR